MSRNQSIFKSTKALTNDLVSTIGLSTEYAKSRILTYIAESKLEDIEEMSMLIDELVTSLAIAITDVANKPINDVIKAKLCARHAVAIDQILA